MMKPTFRFGGCIFFFVLLALFSCHNSSGGARGDRKAIALAKKVLEASGGKENFDKIPYLSFDYFGRRHWFWDKINGRYRVESQQRGLIATGKLDGSDATVFFNKQLVTDPDTLEKIKGIVNEMFINDTYWLLFPFKMLDPGVHLKYLGNCTTDSSDQATCIELTFDKVGLTPGNRYIAYIDEETNQVIWWDFYKNASDREPTLSNPWTDYENYGTVKFSTGRGIASLKDVVIYDQVPEEIFSNVRIPHQLILKKNKID